MSTIEATTFEVSEVERATGALPEVPYKEAVEALLTQTLTDWDRTSRDRGVPSDTVPPPPSPAPIQACTRYHGRLLAGVSYHPVVAAVHRAFMDHRPLRLTPDTIWLMVCQGAASHIHVRSGEHRHRAASKQQRAVIEVRRDDFVRGSPENPWPEVFSEFSAKIREHVGPRIDLFVPDFSTTGPAERAAAEVVLMGAMRSYFDYVLGTRCGIPTITLEGTPDDWRTLADRAEAFAEFGLGRWVRSLRPILGHFARSASGDADRAFWRSIYRLNQQSGGPVITGWITAFFPYLKELETGLATVPSRWLSEGTEESLGVLLREFDEVRGHAHGPITASLPGGLSKAPFLWEYPGPDLRHGVPGRIRGRGPGRGDARPSPRDRLGGAGGGSDGLNAFGSLTGGGPLGSRLGGE